MTSSNFEDKTFLMIPGPTPVPQDVLLSMAEHPLPHRSKEFSEIFTNCNQILKDIAFAPTSIPIIYTASGTGAMEATIANIISPGDKVLSCINGVFSKRWATIATEYQAQVNTLIAPAGQVVHAEQVLDNLQSNPDTKVVLLTYSETSTGARTDIQAIAKVIKQFNSDILIAVDAITGLIAMPLKMDEWGLDIVISGSQKGFMTPPGLSFAWVSPLAMQAHKLSKSPKFYWDWTRALTALDNNTTAFTPNVTHITGLYIALQKIQAEGIENVWARHAELTNIVRNSVKDLGLDLFTKDSEASHAITAVHKPQDIEIADIRKIMKDKYKIIIADGQADLKGKIFRLGHLGYVHYRDIVMSMECLKGTFQDLVMI